MSIFHPPMHHAPSIKSLGHPLTPFRRIPLYSNRIMKDRGDET